VEDQEPDDEGDAVSREIQPLGEQDLLGAVQAETSCPGMSELAGTGQHDPDAQGDHPERQGLLEQVRPAFALPGPPADDVAHGRAGQPSGRPGDPGRDLRDLQDEVRQLGGEQGQHRRGGEANQAPASPGAQLSPQRSGNYAPRGFGHLGRYHGHRRPWLRAGLAKIDSVSVGQVYSTGACGDVVTWSSPGQWRAFRARRRPRRRCGITQAVRMPSSTKVRYKSTIATDKAGASS
jgi:hypothetical protein